MPNTDRLTDAQREAIDALTSAPQYAGASKLRIFMRLPAKHKAAYFREHFLVPCIAAVIAIALCTFVIVRIASPRERPACTWRSSTARCRWVRPPNSSNPPSTSSAPT